MQNLAMGAHKITSKSDVVCAAWSPHGNVGTTFSSKQNFPQGAEQNNTIGGVPSKTCRAPQEPPEDVRGRDLWRDIAEMVAEAKPKSTRSASACRSRAATAAQKWPRTPTAARAATVARTAARAVTAARAARTRHARWQERRPSAALPGRAGTDEILGNGVRVCPLPERMLRTDARKELLCHSGDEQP